jgi:N,N'-diacetylbacillosaminyl-diphospho-undecaprenol alpha-1,3-N-acetylgalactosaminyltransferase
LRIALIANNDRFVYHWRSGLIREIVRRGIHVTVLAPAGDYVEKIQALGAEFTSVPMARFLSPLSDLFLVPRLYRALRKGGFDIVHTMTIKPNVFGAIAAKLAGVETIVCLIAGAGFAFSDGKGLKKRFLRMLSSALYKLALGLCDRVWFQNPDDLHGFASKGIVSAEKAVLIRGSGVNLDEYSTGSVTPEERSALRKELQIPEGAHCVLMVVARMIGAKGISEYLEASALLREGNPDWYFILVAPPEDAGAPDAMPGHLIDEFRKDGRVRIIETFRHDIRVFEAISDIMALPSFYQEGVPRVLIEGLAMSMPLVTTDHPGCRETVEHGKNGFLVPTRDAGALARALGTLMGDEGMRLAFGKHSRVRAENEFGEKVVLKRIFSELYRIDKADAPPDQGEKPGRVEAA